MKKIRVIARCWTVIFLLAALTARAEAPFSFATTPGKLPKTVVPRHYSLEIEPDLTNFTTRGSVTIDIEVLEPVKKIVLNALGLEITRARLVAPEDIPLASAVDDDEQTLTLTPPGKLAPGKYRLALDFTGRIGEQDQGLFYAKYPASSGTKIMLGTQMEPTDARRMFPCWDEPVFRATFELTVVVPASHHAISNLSVESETPLGNGFKRVKFARTPPMASYLVAFVSGELEELDDQADGVRLRVITTEGKKEQGRYALEAEKKILPYYNRYFGIKYPLPKLDLIAIPGGFEGAMENWGAITFSEDTLLFDPKTSSEQTKRDIFVTVAHEMSHQWFGDLVTMAWWDDIWLNEGFASWMEVKATDHFNPGWQMWLGASAERNAVMGADARDTTHPLQTPVASESEASDAFDSITYDKGRAFIRMLESYLGEAEFQRGIHEYLSDHLYSNTTTADLWAALEKTSGKPIKKISTGWTEQPGLPVVAVRAECTNGQKVVSMEQERLTAPGSSARSLRWVIPVALMDTARPDEVRCVLIEGKSAATTFADCQAVIKANAGDVGYYRVSYEPALFQQLTGVFNQLPAADRLNLLNDTWALVEADRLSVTNYFDLVESVRGEKTYAVWDQILSVLDYLDELQREQPGRDAFQTYTRLLLRPQLERLGWDAKPGEPGADALLRARVITSLGFFNDYRVIAEARARFAKFLTDPDSLTADLRPAVVKVVGRYSDKKTYAEIHDLARAAQGTEERTLYYGALADALDPKLARATLALSLTNESPPQEATALVIQVASNGEHAALAWQFAQRHIQQLLPRVDAFDRNGYVPSIMGSFTDAARAGELLAYVKQHFPEDAQDRAEEAAAVIRFNAAAKQRELPELDRWVLARLAKQPKN